MPCVRIVITMRSKITVLMGWLGNWEYARWVPTTWGEGVLALPREIELRSTAGRLRIFQRPIPAFAALRGDPVEVATVALDGARPLTEFTPTRNTYEIDAEFAVTDPQARFGLRLAVAGRQSLTVGYDARLAICSLTVRARKTAASFRFRQVCDRAAAAAGGRVIRLHIYVDQSSVEVANDGEVSLSAVMFGADQHRH